MGLLVAVRCNGVRRLQHATYAMLHEISPLLGNCPSGIFRSRSLVMLFSSPGVHAAFSRRNPNLTCFRQSAEDANVGDFWGRRGREEEEKSRVPDCGVLKARSADVARRRKGLFGARLWLSGSTLCECLHLTTIVQYDTRQPTLSQFMYCSRSSI